MGWRVVEGVLVVGIRKITGAVPAGLVTVPGSWVEMWTSVGVGVGGVEGAGLGLNLDECIVVWEPGVVFCWTY